MAEEFVKVPDIGGESAEVIEINVSPGDSVTSEDTVITLESDKASMEIPASMVGTVVEVLVNVGDSLSEGSEILKLETAAVQVEGQHAVAEPAHSGHEPEPAEAEVEIESAHSSSEPQSVDLCVPDIGGEKAPAVEVSISVGDGIQIDDPIATLESDKATMEIPATHEGVVKAVHIRVGDELGEGDLIATVEVVAAETSLKPVGEEPENVTIQAQEKSASNVVAETNLEEKPKVRDTKSTALKAHDSMAVYAGPAVRRIAREFGVDLAQVKGTGSKQRILKEDVQAFVKEKLAGSASRAPQSLLPDIPEVDFSQWGDVEVEPLSKLQKVAARNFQRSWLNIPHVTQHDDADITELEAFRKAQKAIAEAKGTRLTPLPFLLKAVAYALKEMPKFCASLSPDGQSRILKKYIHIGIAVDTPDGLLVPVLKNVDKKGLWELAQECAELADKARKKQLKPADMKGGCFTISSLGSIGGTAFTPVVNSPEVAILGVSKAEMKPCWNGSEFEPRLMLPLSLSYDHRAINGAEAARFVVLLSILLGDIRKLLL